jgi:ketol-acid reductoisomerase
MRKILEEIRSGQFAKEWITETMAGRPVFKALMQKGERHLVEIVGARLRSMMPWIGEKQKSDKAVDLRSQISISNRKVKVKVKR